MSSCLIFYAPHWRQCPYRKSNLDVLVSGSVEAPYDPGNLIVVPANLRHDPLLRMFQRHEIDAAQLKAAELLRQCHEAASAHGLKAIDLLAEKVDGGSVHAGISDRAIRAARRLREAEILLGWQGLSLPQIKSERIGDGARQ